MRLSKLQREVLYAAAEDRLELANRIQPVLTIAGISYDGKDARVGVEDRTVEGTDSEPAVMLKGVVSGELPEGVEVAMDFLVFAPDGRFARYDGFRGRVVWRKTERGATEFEAYTRGYEWKRTPLKAETEWLNAPAGLVLLSAMGVLQYAEYDFPPSLAEPLVNAVGPERFKYYDTVGEAVTLVEGDTRRVVDTARNHVGMYALTRPAGESVWEIREGVDCDAGSIGIETPDDERYHSVAVYSDVEGVQETLATAEIDNAGADVPVTSVYPMEYTQDDAAAGRVARTMALVEADRRAHDARKLTVPLPYWPFWIDRGEFVTVYTQRYVDEPPKFAAGESAPGVVTGKYLMRHDGFSWGPSRAEASMTGDAVELGVSYKATPRALRRVSGGVSHAPFGLNYMGEPYFSDSLAWVSLDPDGIHLILNVERAEADGVLIFVDPTDAGVVVVRS